MIRLNQSSGSPIHRAAMGRALSISLAAALLAPLAARAQVTKFTEPTKEELAMTSLPGYPGVAAVVLDRDEVTKDDMHAAYHYARIKILTEDGKKYANIELSYANTNDDFKYGASQMDQDDIQGRTIHPDGTIIPFTGKPYVKSIEQTKGIKIQAKVFTLPDVTVGSIIEYRYATRIDDNHYAAPDWIIQGDLYVKSAHYKWLPTSHMMEDAKQRVVNSISWFPLLPPGAEIKSSEIPAIGVDGGPQRIYEVSVKDVPPKPDEEYMPPTSSYTYRVLFNFTPYHSYPDFWKSESKDWSKRANAFAEPNSDIRNEVTKITAGATTPDQKLHAIYADVMKLENTDYTREHESREDKANGLARPKNAADVLHNERGSSDQITELFVAMARAAGLTADLMLVPNRANHIFTPVWMNFGQFDDTIAIVNVDGKEVYFDPGSRYCPYGHLDWEHTWTEGVRQNGNDVGFGQTPGENYTANVTARVANLDMDSSFHITGTVSLGFNGSPALYWRQAALRGDEESLKHQLRTTLEDMVPHSIEVKDISIENLTDYEKPLQVTYTVSGTLGTAAGKRVVVPVDLFIANSHATFPHEKRDQPVYFHYPQSVRDALRINFPAALTVEAVPNTAKFDMPKVATYNLTTETTPTSFTTRRDFAFNTVIFFPKDYSQLRTFYSQFEANDHQSVVLKSAAAAATTASATTGGGN